ncbi:MAG: WD40 repeat domain-containing protein [bacterium]|nr:WD40 repeat domain-containing protein [bacterium]
MKTDRVDHLGDALPAGAVQRLGTRRMRFPVAEMAYSSDGKTAFAISGEALQVWDLEKGECLGIHQVSEHGLRAMDCNATVDRAIIADQTGVVVEWDLEAHKEVHRFETGRSSVGSIAYSPDETRVLTLDLETFTVDEWDRVAGENLISIAEEGERFRNCIYGPDGRTAFVGHAPGNNVYHYSLETGELLKVFAEDYTNYDMCLSADGERLLAGTRHKANEWRLSDYGCLETFTGHLGHAVPSVAYTREDQYLLTGSRDGSIRLWDRKAAEVIRRWYPHLGHVSKMRVSPDGKWVLSYASDGLLVETSLETGVPHVAFERHMAGIFALAFTPDGARCISGSGDGTIRVWDAQTWRMVCVIENPGGEVQGLSVSPDGRCVAAASKDGTVRVMDVENGRNVHTLPGHVGYVYAVAYTPNGQVLSAADDGLVRLWDVEKGNILQEMAGHLGGVLSLDVSADGVRAISGGRDGTVREWDLVSGEMLKTAVAHRGWVNSVAYHPDGRQVLSAGHDGVAIEWDWVDGKESQAFEHGDWVEAVLFLGDGRICTVGKDAQIQVWNRENGERLATLCGHESAVHALVVSPDGEALVSGSADSTALVWRLS